MPSGNLVSSYRQMIFTARVKSLEPTASVGAVSALKPLLFESETQLWADLKEKSVNPEPTAARRVPAAERDARLVNLRRRLAGVLIEGHSEPSHALLDLATQLYDQNALRFIPLEKCYSRCSISQLIAADKAAWSTLIEKNVKPRPDAAGVLELDTKLEEALKSYEVSFTLLPLISKQPPKTSNASAVPSKPAPSAPSKGGKKGGQRYSPYYGKGKSKGKSKGGDQRIPKDIPDAGGTASTPDGQPICFDFSLKRCREQAVDGARCKKGFHVCAICYGPHCMLDHKKA
eukprot:s116_g38.t1